ncbi:hypothetical protein CsSME_00043282 [Camellia sinensis var. sinensis]
MEEASEHNKKQSVPVLLWMRSPIDVSLFDECPLNLLPFLDPRYSFSVCVYSCVFVYDYYVCILLFIFHNSQHKLIKFVKSSSILTGLEWLIEELINLSIAITFSIPLTSLYISISAAFA